MKKTFRKVRAFINKTFLTNCPVCHQHFYGFDDYEEYVRINHKMYRIICHRCALEQKELEKKP